ncbi:Hypothetical predicted protein [Podarcis lilfordi]|uniref:Uncharacterized protein n=1 Tax=Podarcis lilfordi TaxID=74358 RepID=A0AA35NV05_9SAUR|nr:Hypothetical predicted protein [Podarcis lilfordi]
MGFCQLPACLLLPEPLRLPLRPPLTFAIRQGERRGGKGRRHGRPSPPSPKKKKKKKPFPSPASSSGAQEGAPGEGEGEGRAPSAGLRILFKGLFRPASKPAVLFSL